MTDTRLSRTELDYLSRAGGPVRRVTLADRKRGLDTLNRVRRALGARADISSAHLVGTYNESSAKLGKDSAAYVGGVTYAPATAVRRFYAEAPAEVLAQLEIIAEGSPAGGPIGPVLARCSTCARATAQCRNACLIQTAGRYGMSLAAAANSGQAWWAQNLERAKLARTIALLIDPVGMVAVTTACVDRVVRQAGILEAAPRWRLAIADDLRWEHLAPVVLTTARRQGVRMYGYTKWSATERPAPRNVKLVRSVSDRWTVADVLEATAAGETVAMVVDAARGDTLPASWLGRPVIDGDKSDDRSGDRRGAIVMLRAKGAAIGTPTGPRSFVFPVAEAAAMERDELETAGAALVTIGGAR